MRVTEPITDSSGTVRRFDEPRWADSDAGVYSADYGNNLHDKQVEGRLVMSCS